MHDLSIQSSRSVYAAIVCTICGLFFMFPSALGPSLITVEKTTISILLMLITYNGNWAFASARVMEGADVLFCVRSSSWSVCRYPIRRSSTMG